MLEQRVRRAAAALLEGAIRIAPREVRVWGRAMLAEMASVENPWGALMWALGGASVLVRRALGSLLRGGRGRRAPLFVRPVSVGKAMLAAAGTCIVAALVFLAAPPFRQALRVAASPWTRVFRSNSTEQQPGLQALARKAEQRRDAEGLAYCAIHLQDGVAAARLAERAVAIDPGLLWVYVAVAAQHPGLPEITRWVPALERTDSQNAYPFLIAAADIDVRHFRLGDAVLRGHEKDAQWHNAMAAAFRAAKFDDYLGRVDALGREVAARYRLNSPEDVVIGARDGLPAVALEDARRFASSLIQRGNVLEAQGKRRRAWQEYFVVAQFGQLLDSQGHSAVEHQVALSLQAAAYRQLETLSARQGKQTEAAMFGYLTAKFAAGPAEQARSAEWLFGQYVCERNARVLVVSGLAMLLFSGLLVASGSIILVRRCRRSASEAKTTGPMATIMAASSALGLFVSSAALYLTYRPYWYILQQSVLHGERSKVRDLSAFLASTRTAFDTLPGASPNLQTYFWAAVTLLGVFGLTVIFLRHLRFGTGAAGLQSPRPS
ncbi:MAG TPA: hypothetical protein VL523_04925 [Terriglobia bacterium]|nr:hypothetical protein [Terriglobia bacterium]